MSAITEEMTRKFLTKEERKAGQRIVFIRNPFKLVPINNIADIADKFTRNEILSSNEVRGLIGRKPSSDPRADQLRNSNMPDQNQGGGIPITEDKSSETKPSEEGPYEANGELRKAIEEQ
jgi:hypothetical protein